MTVATQEVAPSSCASSLADAYRKFSYVWSSCLLAFAVVIMYYGISQDWVNDFDDNGARLVNVTGQSRCCIRASCLSPATGPDCDPDCDPDCVLWCSSYVPCLALLASAHSWLICSFHLESKKFECLRIVSTVWRCI